MQTGNFLGSKFPRIWTYPRTLGGAVTVIVYLQPINEPAELEAEFADRKFLRDKIFEVFADFDLSLDLEIWFLIYNNHW